MPDLPLATVPGLVFVNCILEGMPVRTPSGDIPIEQLRVGDLVFTRTGAMAYIKDISVDTCTWKDVPDNDNTIVFKIPKGQLGAKQDAFISYWHRIWHKEEWKTAAGIGLAKAKKEEICKDESGKYHLFNLALEGTEDSFIICGGVKVESWSGKIPRVTGGFRFSNGVPAVITA